MTIAYWCVLVTILLPYMFTSYAKFSKGHYDNDAPRLYLENLKGARKRAHWVQLNSFETMPAFAAAVIIAHQVGNEQSRVDIIALAFVLTRILYGVFYIKGYSNLRTFVWTLGLALIVALFFAGA